MFLGSIFGYFCLYICIGTSFIVKEGPNAAGYNFAEKIIHGAIHHSFFSEFQGLSDRTIFKMSIFLGLTPPSGHKGPQKYANFAAPK